MKLPKELLRKKSNTPASISSWERRWTFLIKRLEDLIAKRGKKIVMINVSAEKNPQIQFERYQLACETVRGQFEAVVSTSLPGEERLFWPYQNVQFYLRFDDEIINSTGNSKVIQEIFNVNNEIINTDVADIDFWKQEGFIYCLDDFSYVDEPPLLGKKKKQNPPRKKFRHQQTREFENKEYWYLLNFASSSISWLLGFSICH